MLYRQGIVAALAGLGVGSAVMATSSAAEPPVHLVCSAVPGLAQAPREAACSALAEALGQIAPARPILLDTAGSGEVLVVTLHVTQALPRKIGAVLSWQDGDRAGASPEIAMRVVDTNFDPAAYRALVLQLIEASGLSL